MTTHFNRKNAENIAERKPKGSSNGILFLKLFCIFSVKICRHFLLHRHKHDFWHFAIFYCLCIRTETKGSSNGNLFSKLFWPAVKKTLFYWLINTFEIRGWKPRINKNLKTTFETEYFLTYSWVFLKSYTLKQI